MNLKHALTNHKVHKIKLEFPPNQLIRSLYLRAHGSFWAIVTLKQGRLVSIKYNITLSH